jgi:hypothetical protein
VPCSELETDNTSRHYMALPFLIIRNSLENCPLKMAGKYKVVGLLKTLFIEICNGNTKLKVR